MAQIRYTALVPDDTYFTSQFPSDMFGSRQRASGFELHDIDGNYQNYIVIHGNGLKYRNGYLVGGTITGVEFRDGNDNDYLTITHASVKVTQKTDLADVQYAALAFYTAGESGNDKITGSMQSDVLLSGSGKNTLLGRGGDDTLIAGGYDTLTGGRGADIFVFMGSTKVVIADFDAVGGGENQDYLAYVTPDGSKPRVYQDHHNTVLDFGHRHTLTLLDVDRTDFSLTDDFKMPPIFENG